MLRATITYRSLPVMGLALAERRIILVVASSHVTVGTVALMMIAMNMLQLYAQLKVVFGTAHMMFFLSIHQR